MKRRDLRRVAQCLIVLAAMVLVFTACEKKEEPAPDVAAPAVEPGAKPAPAKPAEKAEVAAPVTAGGSVQSVLELRPDSTMIALGLPPLNGLVDQVLALAKRVVPEGVDVDALAASQFSQMGEEIGVTGAQSLDDVARAKGIDFNAPAALFVDVGTLGAKVKEAAEAGGDALMSGDLEQIFTELGLPSVAAVIPLADPALAETNLKEFLASPGSPFQSAQPEAIEAEGVTIQCYNPEQFCYFVAGNLLVGGTSLDFVKATAARLGDPAPIRYGTADCPQIAPGEIVELVNMDKIMAFVVDIMPALALLDPSQAAMVNAQAEMLKIAAEAYGGDDPAVVTASLTDENLQFLVRIDMAAHPNLMAVTGPAQPLRLAPLLPDATPLFLSIRFNDEWKKNVQENALGSLPPGTIPPQVAAFLPQIMMMLGDELTVGVTGLEGGMPSVVAMLGLANPENTKATLQAFVPQLAGGGENYNNVDIASVQLPLPVPLKLAFVEDVLLASTDEAALKGIIDLLQEKKTSALFESLDPPLDPATPRYSALVLKTSLVAQAVQMFAPMAGGVPPEAQAGLDAFQGLVRDVRFMQEMDGDWLRGGAVINFNPED